MGLAEIAFGDSQPMVVLPTDCDEAWLWTTLPSFQYCLVQHRLLASAHPQWLHLPRNYFTRFLEWLYLEAPTVHFFGGEDVVDVLAAHRRSEFTLE